MFKALISINEGVKNLDLNFCWGIKFRVKVLVGDKKIGEKFCRVMKYGEIFSTGKNFVTLRNFGHFPRHFFSPIKV